MIVTLSGWVSKPTMKTTKNGTQVLEFGMSRKNKDGTKTWYNVQAYGKLADFKSYLVGGEYGTVIGRLDERTYQTKDGDERLSRDINATELYFAPPSDGEQGGGTNFDV